MARYGKKLRRFCRRGTRPLAAGLTVGMVAGWLLLLLAGSLLQPSAAQAAAQVATQENKEQFCMPAVQCHKSMVKQSQCFAADGCCIEDRCFLLGSPCERIQSEGSVDKAGSTGLCYAKSPKIDLTVQIGDNKAVLDLGEYIAAVYNYGVGIVAFLAAIMMMVGGFMYLTAGDSARVSRGKQFIVDSLLGLGVVLSAYVLLNTINPDLVKLQLPKIPIVKKQVFAGCSLTENCAPCGMEYTVLVDQNGNPPGQGDCTKVLYGDNKTVPENWTPGSKCTGKSCALSAKEAGLSGAKKEQCSASKSRCRVPGSATVGYAGADAAYKKVDEAFAGHCGVKDNPKGYVCSFCVPDNGKCNPDGQNDACCSGFCGNNKCGSGLPGTDCDSVDKACKSGICQESWFDSCSTGDIGSYCDGDDECIKGYKCQTNGEHTCSAGTKYSWCEEADQCTGGLVCAKLGVTDVEVCMPSGESPRYCDPDNGNADCTGDAKYCVDMLGDRNICADGSPGAPCDADNDCAPIQRSYTYLYAENGACAEDIHTCMKGIQGDVCDDGNDCQSGRCAKTYKTYMCTSGRVGSICTDVKKASGVSECEGNLVCKKSGENSKTCQYP